MSEQLTRHDRSVAIDYSGGDQILAAPGRGVYVSSAGNLVVRMRSGAADTRLTGLLAGRTYDFEIVAIRQADSTAAGLVLY